MSLRPELEGSDPIALFQEWLKLAESSEPNDPTAAALATASTEAVPSVRMVLVKGIDGQGFRFYTNAGSQKGHEIAENPHASLCFHWKSLRRQVRVSGRVEPLSSQETETYFHSRSRRSQIGAAVSQQSRPLASRGDLEQQVAAFETKHPDGDVPKPDFWCGYLIRPDLVEFWIDGADRLHDRRLFTRAGKDWTASLLYP